MMEVDKYDLCEKILGELETVINREDTLQEFVIIPVSLNSNKSPVVHVGQSLGLESWCVKYVYSYAYEKILKIRKLVAKRKLLYDEYSNVNRFIMGALLINPNVSTFWNIRRELLQDKILDIYSELKFTKLVISHKSKSNEAFAYRKWLVKRLQQNGVMDRTQYFLLWNQEMKVCDMAAKKSSNNYHAWSHRIWFLENFANFTDVGVILSHELSYSETWISVHVSECTGFHYRQYITSKMQNRKIKLDEKYRNYFYKSMKLVVPEDERDEHIILVNLLGNSERHWTEAEISLLFKEIFVLWHDLNLNTELNETFEEHETIWCHRRYIIHRIFSLLCKYFGVEFDAKVQNLDLVFTGDKRECNIVENKMISSSTNQKLAGERSPKVMKHERSVLNSSRFYRNLINREKAYIEKCSKIRNRQNYLAKRHEKWLYYISCVIPV